MNTFARETTLIWNVLTTLPIQGVHVLRKERICFWESKVFSLRAHFLSKKLTVQNDIQEETQVVSIVKMAEKSCVPFPAQSAASNI